MKKIIETLLIIAVLILPAFSPVFAITETHKPTVLINSEVPEQKLIKTDYGFMSIHNFLNLTPSKIKELTGKKPSLKERIGLWWVQKQVHKQALVKHKAVEDTGAFKINWGAFALGVFLGLIGLIISFFFKDKKAWISALLGWGIFLAVFLLVLTLGKT